jgi:6-phosphogluconolactonase
MKTRSVPLFGRMIALLTVMILLLSACTMIVQPEGESGAAAPEPTEAAGAADSQPAAPAESAATWESDAAPARFAYVGSYTTGAPGGWSDAAEASHPEGFHIFAVDGESGALTFIETVPSVNPSFIAIDPTQSYLYVINEIADYEGEDAGSIEAYAIDDETGTMTLLNRQAVGSIPAHLSVDPTGSYVVVANYVGGSWQVLPINPDGSLAPVSDTIQESGSGPNAERQEAPHGHAILFDPTGQYMATADLGTDVIKILRLEGDQFEEVSQVSVAPGSGPRHVAFHPNGTVLYMINELNATITALAFDPATGEVGDEIQTISTVTDDFPEEKSTAEIFVHPSGRFLYGSNRGFVDHPVADSIVAYSIDQATGELTLIGHTTENIDFPRGFAIDPTGKWLYAMNQHADTIVQFEINVETGELTPTGNITEAPVPVSMVFKQ